MKSCPTCQGSYPNTYAVCPQDGTQLIEVGAWSDGAVIRGKYRIVTKVGQGGMGSVFKALHLAFDELRALKVMSPELMSDELFVKRFKHEAVITRKLQHPNAVRVDDIDEADDGRPYIVMEYIEGQSLKKLIQEQGPLPVPRVCSIIKQAAAALDAAHGLGMVHRDIKPDNIVLVETPEGEQAKVLDFGIAKVKEARLGGAMAGLTLTGTGVVIGTPQYMSPEQAMGKRGDELDGRSDLYSLGIVMYQMLTGDLPFKADTTMEMLLAHMQKPPMNIAALRPDLQIPGSIARLVMKTLEKKPELRPPTAKALIEEIARAERDMAPAGATRVVRPSAMMASEAVEPAEHPAAGQAPYGVGAGPASPPPRVAPPTPALEPRPTPAAKPPVQPPSPVRIPPPKESRWGLWVAMVILAVGLGGGAWYFKGRSGLGPSTSVVEENSKKVSERLARGDEHLKVREYEPAIQEYHEGLSLDPSNTILRARLVEAHEARGNQLLKKGEYDNAIREYEDGLKHDPSNAILTSSLNEAQKAKAASLSKGTEVATRGSETLVDTKKVNAAIKMGDFYFGRREYDSAIREYENGRKLDPSNATLASKIEEAQKARSAPPSKRREVAQRRSEPSVDPQKVGAAIKMGDFYYNRGEYDNAIGEYVRGLSLDPSNATLRSNLDRARKAKAAEGRVLQ